MKTLSHYMNMLAFNLCLANREWVDANKCVFGKWPDGVTGNGIHYVREGSKITRYEIHDCRVVPDSKIKLNKVYGNFSGDKSLEDFLKSWKSAVISADELTRLLKFYSQDTLFPVDTITEEAKSTISLHAPMTFEADAHRLALELECLLLSCDDTAVTAMWWESANDALEQHRELVKKTYQPFTD